MEETDIKPKISVIIPAYNEAENIPVLYKDLVSTASVMRNYNFEFVFIDDASEDDTPNILEDLMKKDGRIEIIHFTRNRGSHPAISAGLCYCSGRIAVLIPADMQDLPSTVIPLMAEQWEKGYRVVWGIREERRGESFGTLLFSRIYYWLINRLTDVRQPPLGIGTILLDRVAIDALNKIPEKNSSISMLIAWIGFSHTSVNYVRQKRHAGRSKWNINKKIKLSLDSLISFSFVPIRFMTLFGVACTVISALYSIWILIDKMLNNVMIQGWSSIMIVVMLIGGVQMIMLGILGEYLWRTYDETRRRPQYIIDKNTLSAFAENHGS